jgi:protoporphyrinogen oxidase
VRRREGLRLVRLPRLLRRYGVRLDSERPEQGASLDDRSLADFGRLYFGRSVLDYWLAPFITSVSLGDASETSRVHYLLRHLRHFGARRGLLRAALAELAEAAAERLPTLYGAEVTGLESGRDGRLLLTYTREGRERMLELRAVIVATPASETARVAAPLLTGGEREALEGVRYVPSVTLAAGACRPLSWHPVEIRVPHAEGSVLEVALLEPGMIGGRVPDGYGAALLQATSAWSAQAQQLPDETVEKELLDALEWIQPAARAAVDFARVFRSEDAWPRFDVGHYHALERLARIGGERRREGRRVYLAGDYRMDPSWNGAVASGLRAARELADDFGG